MGDKEYQEALKLGKKEYKSRVSRGEFPYLPVYINAFSPVPESQRAFVKVLFGEIEAVGKNPVSLPGFFEREV